MMTRAALAIFALLTLTLASCRGVDAGPTGLGKSVSPTAVAPATPTPPASTKAAPTRTPAGPSRAQATPAPTHAAPVPTLTGRADGLTFAVQADPHMDEQSRPSVYEATLQRIVAARPAFLIDLGDIFMIDKLSDRSDASVRNRYTLMKGYYDLLNGLPLFFAMGNHDGEAGWDRLNARAIRQEFFPAQTGAKNYYAFERDNALFVVLDPYTYTSVKPNADGWGWTLGREQYDWLKATLKRSRAQFKFVFIHQLVGGDEQGRGGVEFATRYEWGGSSLDGSDGFATRRPGWGKPIHQLLKDNGVAIVFKGHDHLYARQDYEGVTYQTVPQPSHPGDKVNEAREYGYQSGTVLGGSGFLSVRVTNANVTVAFIRADGQIADRYTR